MTSFYANQFTYFIITIIINHIMEHLLSPVPQHPFDCFLVTLWFLAFTFAPFFMSWDTGWDNGWGLAAWFFNDVICFYIASICIWYYLLNLSVSSFWLVLLTLLPWFCIPITIGFMVVKNSARISPLLSPFALSLNFLEALLMSLLIRVALPAYPSLYIFSIMGAIHYLSIFTLFISTNCLLTSKIACYF